jgi:thioredoxin 1
MGPAVIEFGSNTCGYCMAAQPLIAEAFAGYGNVRHIKIQDGKGRPLGRSFRVKLWPTLVFLKDGKEVKRASYAPTMCAQLKAPSPTLLGGEVCPSDGEIRALCELAFSVQA